MNDQREPKPQVFIMRGIPGSGKSTFVKNMIKGQKWVVSADDFFMVDGVYQFEPKSIGEAHQACWLKFYNYIEKIWKAARNLGEVVDQRFRDITTVVVDNTNIHTHEISPYVLPAEARGFAVTIITIQCDPARAFKRNIHQVPGQVIERMYQDMQTTKFPAYYSHKEFLQETLSPEESR